MHKMFRYLNKYVGTYRVLAHYDDSIDDFPRDVDGSIDESFDDMYIPTSKKGEIRATYRPIRGKEILCYYNQSRQIAKKTYQEILNKYPDIYLEFEDNGQFDSFIYFYSEDIEKIADVVKPRTSGAKIKPYSNKNLPKNPYEIPEEDEKRFSEIINQLDKNTKMLFVRKCCSEFDEIISEKKGKKYDVSKERKLSKLRPKAFISYIGIFNEFIEFVKEKYNQEFENQ